MLAAAGFDRWAEERCARFYAEKVGRPGVPPGVYFRMLMIGYLEGIDSERGIAWRCADSLSLREFLGCDLTRSTPDNSTLSVVRGRIDVETHREVFGWILERPGEHGLLKGKTIGVDATTLEANAALRPLVRREMGEGYTEFLEKLARESGIATTTREELAKLDRTRKNKASNDDWENPNDPDAKITKIKDGRTHLAHKAEHAVDLETGAIVGVTIQPADRVDTSSLGETMENLDDAGGHHDGIEEVVTDRATTATAWCATWRRWAFAAMPPSPFAHCYGTGRLRRTHLRGHGKLLKRVLIHVGACNLSLLMRRLFGVGTPRGLQGATALLARAVTRSLGPARSPIVRNCLGRLPNRAFRSAPHPRLLAA